MVRAFPRRRPRGSERFAWLRSLKDSARVPRPVLADTIFWGSCSGSHEGQTASAVTIVVDALFAALRSCSDDRGAKAARGPAFALQCAASAVDAEEGRWLLAALRAAAHLHLGLASFSEYVERSFGYRPRSTQEKLRVAEALEELPVLTQALQQGTIHWSAVRELTRVAVPENEREWLAIAHGKSLRQLAGTTEQWLRAALARLTPPRSRA
jgi:hypothetical protein